MFTPLAQAAEISVGLARRLDMPICAVPSMIAAMPVVEPSAAISKLVPGFCALNCLGQLRHELGAEGVGTLDDQPVGMSLGGEQAQGGGNEEKSRFHVLIG